MTLPPGPRHPRLWTTARWLIDPYALFAECAARHGGAFTLRPAAFHPTVVVSDPDAVGSLFAADPTVASAGRYNAGFANFLGPCSLLALEGERHARHRQLIGAALGRTAIDDHIRTIVSERVEGWRPGTTLSLHEAFRDITLRVILQALLGASDRGRLEQAVARIATVVDLGTSPWVLLPWVRRAPVGPWARFLRARDRARALLDDEIAARRVRAAPGDVLSELLQATLSDDELRDEIVTLVVTGHETTATALAWAMRWVLADRALLERLQAEIAEASPAGACDVAAAPLLDATIRETLRIVPVVPSVGRLLIAPARIGAFELPADVTVMASTYLAGRRSQTYAEPERFRPERFLERYYTPHEWFPFGGGDRRCIGSAFAMREMKLVLAEILARTQLTLADRRPVAARRRGVTVAPAGGVRVVVDRVR